MESFNQYFLNVVKNNYANFNGRARRKEYWMFALYIFIFLICAMILDNILGLTINGLPYGALYISSGLALTIPTLAMVVRRLHDNGKSGWFYLIVLVPFVGAIWLFVLLVQEGAPIANQYGEDPKAGER